MTVSEQSFYKNFGFDDNPFQYTNADEEDRLAEYFIPPPFFNAVWGNPKKPSPVVVFAPRGGGKSAQRRMIEAEALKHNILAITYDRFEFQGKNSLDKISLSFHINNIIKRVLLGFLSQIHIMGLNDMRFTSAEKDFIHKLCLNYLGHMTQPELVSAIESLKSSQDKIKHLFDKFSAPISSIVNAVLLSQGIPGISFSSSIAEIEKKLDESGKYNLLTLGELVKSIGFDSIYILIDRLDETELTGNNSESTFKLLEPLVKDLELLTLKNYGFKFFLWDEIEPFYREHARPDRIPQHILQWDFTKIQDALKKRLLAYSSKKIGSLSDITISGPFKENNFITELVLFFANNSPRDVVRLCGEIFTHQQEITLESKEISSHAIIKGIETYSQKRSAELIDVNKLRELKKLRRLDFTINQVANEVFKVSNQAASAKIQGWERSGLVKRVGEKTVSSSKKPVYHYAVADIRLAKEMFNDLGLWDFVINKIRRCDRCFTVVIRDFDVSVEHICQECGCTKFK